MPAEQAAFEENFKPPQICPYLGLGNDPGSYFQFASTWNCCHKPEKIVSLKTGPQAKYCLSEAHLECPVFQDDWDGEFPKDWAARSWERERERKSVMGRGSVDPQTRMMRFGTGLLVVTLAVFGIIALTMPSVRERLFPGAGQGPVQTVPAAAAESETPTPAATDTPTPLTPTPIVTATPSITPSPTVTPLPTDTPLPTPGPGLETPFGPDSGFLIHVVEAGESFGVIANQYETTPEVLMAANPIVEGASLWAGRQLVIPLGRTDVGGIPAFTVIFTTEAVSIENLAAVHNSDPEGIRFYNSLGQENSVPSGRWLIIPLNPE